ncbi:MAG: EAL domain-containing protein [Gammaproteobacteria bacterium]
MPLIVLGDDTNEPQRIQMLASGVQEYLLKSSLDCAAIARSVRGAIARKNRDNLLFGENERAQVILRSIGDAVVSTNKAGSVTYLNPVAEKLIGWTNKEAAGRDLMDVFQVIDGTTRERIVPQMKSEVKKGRTMILPPNCILVARDGQESPIEDSAAPIYDRARQVAGMVVVFHDVSESRAMTQQITHLAEHDILTSLPNRALLVDRLDQGIVLARRHERQLAVLFVDLDHFKRINDSLGHLVGDQLLKAVSQRINRCVRGSDTVSRQGGDEFLVLLTEIGKGEDPAIVAEKIRLAIIEPFSIADHYLHLSVSIGVSVYPDDADNAESLIHCADTAMYHAKEKGRNNIQYFKDEMSVRAAERQFITEGLRLALSRGEFVLEYQPKVNLTSGEISGIEALVRWQHPQRGLLYPSSFIPIAEDCGLIIPIGQWVLHEACVQAHAWHAAGLAFGTMAVNISAVEFRSDRFYEGVRNVLRTTGIKAHCLELELTETAVMRDYDATSVVLRALSGIGVRIAVDDFGTGYSNLSYLKRFPINTLKLDRSFVNDVPKNADVSTIVRSVIEMAHSLNLQVVAEGIETEQQLDFLRAHHCGEGQGFLFNRPMNAAKCQTLLVNGAEFCRTRGRRCAPSIKGSVKVAATHRLKSIAGAN